MNVAFHSDCVEVLLPGWIIAPAQTQAKVRRWTYRHQWLCILWSCRYFVIFHRRVELLISTVPNRRKTAIAAQPAPEAMVKIVPLAIACLFYFGTGREWFAMRPLWT